MDPTDKLLVETSERAKSNSHRIEKLEVNSAALQKLATSVEVLAKNMETMTKEQEAQGKRLAMLEEKPAKQWNNMMRTIFTTVVSTLTGGVVGALVAILFR